MIKLEKRIQARLPFDRRDENPGNNYGIHGIDLWYILVGPHGAVQFAVSFPIYLPHVENERDWSERHSFHRVHAREPRGFDVGYHSPKPMYDDQTDMKCDILGGRCYYDGSGLTADEWAKEIFSVRGEVPEKTLWRKLGEYYCDRFGVDENKIGIEE